MIKKLLFTIQSKVSSPLWSRAVETHRAVWKCIAFPIVMTLIAALAKPWCFPGPSGIPYLAFFGIFILSAIFGGAIGALVAALITFSMSLFYILIADHKAPDLNQLILQAIFFFLEVGFLTGLVYCLQELRKASENHFTAIQQNARELLAREKNHDDFVQVAAHELKSPVTVLKAYTQLIMSKFTREGRREDLEFLHKMNLQLEKLQHRIADLMDVAKANVGTLDYAMKDFCINTCLKQCIEDVKTAQPDFVVEATFDPSYPLVYGDQDRIGQVVINLMGNSVKYVSNEKYIKVSSAVDEGQILIEVEDHGMGIPLDMQQHVFERFFRVKKDGTKELPGSGLGLFISSEIVRKHNGKIGLYSEEGKGAVFWFSLPIKTTAVQA